MLGSRVSLIDEVIGFSEGSEDISHISVLAHNMDATCFTPMMHDLSIRQPSHDHRDHSAPTVMAYPT